MCRWGTFSVSATRTATETKRYDANDQLLAARLGDEALYHVLNDPTGLSLTMVNGNGTVAGRVLYNGFGSVLDNTLPVSLTGSLLGHPDAAAGLVHMGDGRWLDPALGRPLQPNPNGGPPTVPQALNRFVATSLGQPGVAQSVLNQPDVTLLSLVAGATKSSAAEILARATVGPFGRAVTTVTGKAQTIVRVTASRTALGRAYKTVQGWDGTLQGSLGAADGTLQNAIFRLGPTEKTAADLITDAGLPQAGRWTATVKFEALDAVVETTRYPRFPYLNGFKIGLVTDVLLGVGFQLYGDSHDPYLMPPQRVGRIIVAGFGGVASASIGFGTASLAGVWLCGPGIAICASAAVIGVIGSVVTSYAWNHLQPSIFESFGFNSERNLAPLN